MGTKPTKDIAILNLSLTKIHGEIHIGNNYCSTLEQNKRLEDCVADLSGSGFYSERKKLLGERERERESESEKET